MPRYAVTVIVQSPEVSKVYGHYLRGKAQAALTALEAEKSRKLRVIRSKIAKVRS